jgi:hypothetical protein
VPRLRTHLELAELHTERAALDARISSAVAPPSQAQPNGGHLFATRALLRELSVRATGFCVQVAGIKQRDDVSLALGSAAPVADAAQSALEALTSFENALRKLVRDYPMQRDE